MIPLNEAVAERLEEVGRLLEQQGANPFRVRAWRRGAGTVRRLDGSVAEVVAQGGLEALEALPTIGESLARAIETIVRSGRLPLLDRLRGEADPEALLRSVPGIGARMAHRLHEELHVESLEELEAAAHDGRLEAFRGIGTKRLAAVRDHLAQRLQRVRRSRSGSRDGERPAEPPVSEILDVDAEYRRRAAAGELERIAPRRFNPENEAWLPVLHATRGGRHYTALHSNTRRAHELGTTRDWVVIYLEGEEGERQWTVITSTRGSLAGRRIVRGREDECRRHYRAV